MGIQVSRKKSILFEGLNKTKLKYIDKLIWGEVRGEKRVRLPSETKNKVYERAKGGCESCGMPLKMTGKGVQFHHTRKPTVKSRASTIQFLCATCHRKYGHEFYTVTKQDPFYGTTKETKIRRKKVRKHPSSPYWKKKPKTNKKKPITKKTQRKTKPKRPTRKKKVTKARKKRR